MNDVYDIVYLTDKNLKTPSTLVDLDNELNFVKNCIDKMFNTMYKNNGIGLAAPQVGINKRFFIMDINSCGKKIMINPVILEKSEIMEKNNEGCLSLPGGSAEVNRHSEILVSWVDINGNTKQDKFDGLASVCIQHEIDHLDGILFVDRLSKLKKSMVVKKVLKNI